MDIATFVQVAKSLPSEISILIRGGHGIGKSETVHQIAQSLGLELIDRRMSQMTEGDVIGLPKLENDCTKFLPAEFIQVACTRPVMLFLDEINRATQEVMQACFQLCLDRELNGNRLHPGTRIFAAVNASAAYQVNEMDPAFLDRFFVVDLAPTAQDFFAYAEGIDPNTNKTRLNIDLLTFLKEQESRLDPAVNVNPGSVQPSRRSWFRLDKAYRAVGLYEKDFKEDSVAYGRAYSVALGFVGVECANELVDYLKNRESNFTAEDVYKRYDKNRAKIKLLPQSKLNTLNDQLAEHAKNNLLDNDDAANLGKYVEDLPGELRVSFFTNYTKQTRESPHFATNFRTINPHVVQHIIVLYSNETENQKPSADGEETANVKKSTKKAKKA